MALPAEPRSTYPATAKARMAEYPGPARDRAVAAGITINGLAILNEEPYLAEYYYRTVIGGPGAFVMSATGYESFAEAIRLKILRELVSGPVAVVGAN